ncbi:hypothetical protein SUGI_0658630 [Cryptomeria japonica]|uniref:uncharacterized protein LOC131068670 n=1 Tax=Cryptomeria japonica TaxID=3369 RepID=UPI002414CF37|nr:uncharacterized protein LOC131068670 [Cryptomeria japonica]GLJ32728.1 hypothetical protein SUGI_0658630 [Cryptomeria japonica]
MRIRRRFSSISSDKAVASTCTEREEEERWRGEEFLLPLAAAVVEVGGGGGGGGGEGGDDGIGGIHTRRPHSWRNVLFQCNTPDEAVQVRGGGDKPNYGWNGIIRGNPEDNLGLLPSEGSSVEQEITQLELPRSGGSEKCLMWEKKKSTITKNTSKLECITKCHVIRHINASAKEERKTKCKARGDDDNEERYMHTGSQCRRRNGRGWRCSQRTLVGYHLCEHHLGKGRLKSINSTIIKGGGSGISVSVNNKGTKFKELHLIHATAAVFQNVEPEKHTQFKTEA